MKGGEAAVGEARGKDLVRREVEERGTESEAGILLAASAGAQVDGIFKLQFLYGHHAFHLRLPRTWCGPSHEPSLCSVAARHYGKCLNPSDDIRRHRRSAVVPDRCRALSHGFLTDETRITFLEYRLASRGDRGSHGGSINLIGESHEHQARKHRRMCR